MHLKPPDDQHQERDPYWTPATGWPAEAKWGYVHDADSVTISAVGLIPVSEPVPWNGRLLDFDHAVGQWRHLLRDWLSVIAEGPTDFLDLPVRGETQWADEGYTNEVWTYYYDNLQRPQRVSRWQWEHVLAHIHAGDQPPLARGTAHDSQPGRSYRQPAPRKSSTRQQPRKPHEGPASRPSFG